MANYVSNHIYINGSKQAVVDFLNKGLKGNKAKERVSLDMSGEEIVALINGLEQPLSMGSYFPRPKTFDTYDTTNRMKPFRWWYDSHYADDFIAKTGEEIKAFQQTHPDISSDDALTILHPEVISTYRKYVRGYRRAVAYQKKKYGVVGWYDWNKENYGCKWDMPIEDWSCEKDSDDTLCLYVGMQTPWSPAYKFIEKLNAFEGITVYAYASGDVNEPFFYWFNGRTGEEDDMKPEDNERYEQRKKELDAIKEQKVAEAGSLRISVIPELFLVGEKRSPQCVPSEFEWIRVEGDEALVGVSDEAKFIFGEIVSVDIVSVVGKVVPQGEVIGTVKTVNTVYDLYMPATGEVLAINAELQEHPELVNTDLYDAGWMIRIRLSDPSEIDKLLTAEYARMDAVEEWADAMIDLDWEMLRERKEQFIKEIYAEMGLEYPPKPHYRSGLEEPKGNPEEEWKPYVHNPDLPF